jgi:hypothetical protein
LIIEKCGQKPMKTPNGHNMQVFHGPVLDHQPHVPNRPQPIPRLGTPQLTWKELKLKLRISGKPNMPCFSQGGANKKNGSLTSTVDAHNK